MFNEWMLFNKIKLPASAVSQLRKVAIDVVKPYVLMMAPAYIFMRRNEKFISVKEPLDFFEPDELKKYSSFKEIYFADFIDEVAPFHHAARVVRRLLSLKDKVAVKEGESFPNISLAPSTYEISDAVIRSVGPLWSSGRKIEPFFVIFFADELCGPFPKELLLHARDQDVNEYEYALIRSSLAVFFALHLGHCHLGFLQELRASVFKVTLGLEKTFFIERRRDLREIVDLIDLAFKDLNTQVVQGGAFSSRKERFSQKIASRLDRIDREFIDPDKPLPTIHGSKGFKDV